MTKPQKVPVEEARKKIADLLDGTQHHDAHFEITRRGKSAGHLSPPSWYAAAVEALAENKALRRELAALRKTPPAVAAPGRQVAQPLSHPRPATIAEPGGVELTDGQAWRLVATARKAASGEQRETFRRVEATAKSLGRDVDLAIIEAAFKMGLLTNDDVVAAGTLYAMGDERAAVLGARARKRTDEKGRAALDQAAQMTGSAHRDYAVVAKAHSMGLLTDAELEGVDEEAAPARPEEEH